MAIKLPNDKICYNLPEQVAANAENVKALAEAWSEYGLLFASYKEEWENEILPAFNDIPAEVLSVLEDADVKVKTIEQTEPNYSLDLDSQIDVSVPTGISSNIEYYRGEIINGIFYFTMMIQLTNTTASSINLGNTFLIFLKQIDEALADKIYCVDGNSISISSTTDKGVSTSLCDADGGSPTEGLFTSYACPVNKIRDPLKGARTLGLKPRNVGAISAGSTWTFLFRFYLNVL